MPHVMINGKAATSCVPATIWWCPGAYHTVGNPNAEVGHVIAAFRTAMEYPPVLRRIL